MRRKEREGIEEKGIRLAKEEEQGRKGKEKEKGEEKRKDVGRRKEENEVRGEVGEGGKEERLLR